MARVLRGGEEVPPVIPPLAILAVDEAEVGLVNEGCRLERVPRLLPGEPLLGLSPALIVDEWPPFPGDRPGGIVLRERDCLEDRDGL